LSNKKTALQCDLNNKSLNSYLQLIKKYYITAVMKQEDNIKTIATNKKARHSYFIEDKIEAGLVLLGTEVKALRMGKANLKDSYAKIDNEEVYIYNMHIGKYPFAYYENHKEKRKRKLLIHKRQIRKLYGKVNEKGTALIPLSIYFKNGKAKVLLGLAKGKKLYDKRETIKKRDEQRDFEREQKKNQRIKF
jgi:SsrA-binding protein